MHCLPSLYFQSRRKLSFTSFHKTIIKQIFTLFLEISLTNIETKNILPNIIPHFFSVSSGGGRGAEIVGTIVPFQL